MADDTRGADRTEAGPPNPGGSPRRRVFNVIDSTTPGNWKGLWFDRLMTVLILTNVSAVILETVE